MSFEVELPDAFLESTVIHDVIGQGRHGTVFLASSPGDHTDASAGHVAVKVAIDGGCLVDEAAALERFAHPHVVTLLDHAPDVLILEYCESGTLADRMRFAPTVRADLSQQLLGVLDAVANMHVAGWIHGDITPANIGIRRDGSAALMDFSTAREADGKPLLQGTKEYAGELRTADAVVDVRCIAATARAALGTPDRWDIGGTAAVHQLDDVIERIDSGAAVELHDLRTLIESLEDTPDFNTEDILSTPPQPSIGRTSPPTRDYGPRPSGGGDERSTDPNTITALRLLGAAAVLAAVFLLGVSMLGRSSSATPPPDELALTTTISAQATLDDASAEWTGGTLVRQDDGGASSWSVGQAGDLAAVADWNCDGVATLGVLRPDTMTWFAFDSWAAGSSSSVTVMGEPSTVDPRLYVAVDSTGCASPVILQ